MQTKVNNSEGLEADTVIKDIIDAKKAICDATGTTPNKIKILRSQYFGLPKGTQKWIRENVEYMELCDHIKPPVIILETF